MKIPVRWVSVDYLAIAPAGHAPAHTSIIRHRIWMMLVGVEW
jgi:hypothetical protein